VAPAEDLPRVPEVDGVFNASPGQSRTVFGDARQSYGAWACANRITGDVRLDTVGDHLKLTSLDQLPRDAVRGWLRKAAEVAGLK